MARHFMAARATGIGSVTLPLMSLYSPANNGGVIREIGIFGVAATAVELYIRRLTTAGTQGAGIAEGDSWEDSPAATMTGFHVHTSTGPTLDDIIRAPVLGAAIGAGIIYTFGGPGLIVPPGVANGVGIILATGTGQLVTAHWEWEE